MIMWTNSSLWSLMDLRYLQTDSLRDEMLTVGSEEVFPALLVIFFMRCFSSLPQHPPPPFSLLLCTYAYKTTNFLHPPITIPHCFATYVERWSQEAKSLASLHSREMGKTINLWQITKCYPANWRRCKEEPSGSNSFLPLNRCHISRSACVFHQKLWTHRPQAGKYL